MRAVVTGAAGFIGSHLAQALARAGARVIAVDCLTDYYDPARKRANLEVLGQYPLVEIVTGDLLDLDLVGMVEGADVVFHQAGQPGVRLSWDDGFPIYSERNILATQSLLEAARSTRLPRFVYASSSSVYGDQDRYPCTEDMVPRPHSPYGVTKLAAEHLCRLYSANYGLSTVSLRYFTVYGPRQRPDMAIQRLVQCAVDGDEFEVFGDGSQVRDFTYVGDIVAANLRAAGADVAPGTFVNISGGSEASLAETIELVARASGAELNLGHGPAKPGDVARTGGSPELAHRLLGWEPRTDLRTGITRQLEWYRNRSAKKLSRDGTAA
ncbi:MAG TPA: NAD-dependent epimerase/dehydratase family protein [Acidimicrobiales bacterium]|nr:NAD-dependent epimerase/dehydratase family protein [Acidimicrobiales bacterium]